MKKRRTLQDLTIKDNFLFGAVMHVEENCKGFLELVLGFPIAHVVVSKERSMIYHPEYKGVRLDIYAEDENHTHYNVEMQMRRKKALGKRSRYYHSQIVMEALESGEEYETIPDTFVIFVCDFDPFGKELYCYTFQNECKEGFRVQKYILVGKHYIGWEKKKQIYITKEIFLGNKTMEKLFNFIFKMKDLLDTKNNDRRKFFNEYIEPTYCQGKQVYTNLMEILQQTQEMLLDENIDAMNVVEFLKKARSTSKISREELRNRTFVIINRKQTDTDFYVFAIAIREILCGGMTGAFFQHNCDMIDSYIEDITVVKELCFYEGKHTLLDLIEKFDDINQTYCGEESYETYKNQEKYRQLFLAEVKRQLLSLEQYFKLLVNSYEKIKWKTYSH